MYPSKAQLNNLQNISEIRNSFVNWAVNFSHNLTDNPYWAAVETQEETHGPKEEDRLFVNNEHNTRNSLTELI